MYTGFATEAAEQLMHKGTSFLRGHPLFCMAPLEQHIELLRIYMDSSVRLITKEA
jgi:hypothetical protein